MKTCLFIPLAALLLAAGCKKDDPAAGLPPATQVGANTGGCLINGERFVATGWDSGSVLSNPVPPLSGGFSFDSIYRVELHGQYNGQNTTVMLFLKNDQVGSYQLNKTTQYWPQGSSQNLLSHATFSAANSAGDVYVTDVQHVGQVVLTRSDLSAGVGAGTFEFTAASTFDPRKTITITNGRFDRKQ